MNANIEFELFTKRIYEKLSASSIVKPVKVEHNVKLEGKSGCKHQIDVYWEYEDNGVIRKVAIECKNYKEFVPIGKVRDFFGVLFDLGDVQGIMVSSKGFQEGAVKFAKQYGIKLKTLRSPEYDELFGSINLTIQYKKQNCLFGIDPNWIEANHFSLQKIKDFYSTFQPSKEEYWQNSKHFPIEYLDQTLRNSHGEILTTLEELGKGLPDNLESGHSVIFTYEDAWLESRYWGKVKIREVKFEWEYKEQNKTLYLLADDFVDGILKDVASGESAYIAKTW